MSTYDPGDILICNETFINKPSNRIISKYSRYRISGGNGVTFVIETLRRDRNYIMRKEHLHYFEKKTDRIRRIAKSFLSN